MNGLNYLLQTNLYLILFMGFYTLVLRNETFFRQNRFYLNTSIFLSFAVPFINSDWFRDLFITQKVREVFNPSQIMFDTIIVGANEEASQWTPAEVIYWIYISGAALLLARFLIRLMLLRSNLKAGKGTAFSFFNTILVDMELPKAETIMDHEKVHMRQWHSADIIFIEITAIINWFNPVMYLYKKEIRHIHEFIADEEAANLMQSKSDYAILLFSNTLGVDPHQLINNFFNKSLLKRRIIMLNKNRSRSTGLWKYGFSAPLFALMLILSSATANSDHSVLNINSEKTNPLLNALSPAELNKTVYPGNTNKVLTGEGIKSTATNNNTNLPTTSIKEAEPNVAELKQHIQRNIRYPASARENNITGYVMVNFSVRNNKITGTKIVKSLRTDIDNEVLRTFNLFKDPVQLENKTYSMAIIYSLISESQNESLPIMEVPAYNHLGQVVVKALGQKSISGPYQLQEVVIGDTIKDFTSVEFLPEFQGGMKGWGEYLSKTLKYPEEAKKNRITGRVILSFIVRKDGSITDIKVLRGIGGGADEEAVRVVAASPKWKPGIQKGRPVNVAYTMPIFFQLPPQKEQN